MFMLYPATLLQSLICFRIFYGNAFVFSTQILVSLVKKKRQFYFFFSMCIPFLLLLARTFSMMLKRSGKRRSFALFLILLGKILNIKCYISSKFLQILFIKQRKFPSFHYEWVKDVTMCFFFTYSYNCVIYLFQTMDVMDYNI